MNTLGSLSMTCYNVGPDLDLPRETQDVTVLPERVPPDQTNI